MSLAAHSTALATRAAGALDGWHVVQDPNGIVDVIDAQPASVSVVRFWSLLEAPIDWPSKQDKLQVELVVTLPWLEKRLLAKFNNTFSNEMGKTVSVFLHRLAPNGRSYGAGFPLSHSGDAGALTVQELANLVNAHGVPFLRSVARGDAFDEEDFLSPKLIDPVNWAVRRAIALEYLGRQGSAYATLSELAPKIERELEAKYSALAAVSRAINPGQKVRANLARLNIAIERLRGDA